MKKKLLLFVAVCLISSLGLAGGGASAETATYDSQIVKMDGLATLYYVMEGKRYVFPNAKTYDSWFISFADVKTLTQTELQALPLAGNVLYRPGVILVKVTTDPKVYAVAKGGELRWIKTEALAKKLYGNDWNILIDDLPDAFFTNYHIGSAIENDADFDPDTEADNNDSIDKNHGKALGHAKRAQTTKCRAIPAVPAVPGHKLGTTTPAQRAIPARVCKAAQDEDENNDKAAPLISALTAGDIASTSARITWTTDENADSSLSYAIESLTTATSSIVTTVGDPTSVTSHSFILSGLSASTTYYYLVKSKDASGNLATSSENTFKTLE